MFERRVLTRAMGAGLLTLATGLGCNDRQASLPTGPSPAAVALSPPAQPPTSAAITDIVPNSGGTAGATLVRINGQGLQGSVHVTFGGVPALRVGWSPGGASVVATTPANAAGPVDVVVTTGAGQAVTLRQGFTYGRAAPLSLTSIAPNAGATAGGTLLTIAGDGFQFGARVTLDGVDTPVRYQLVGTTLDLATPPHRAGAVDVVVINPDGQVARLDAAFTYASSPFSDFNGDWEGWLGDEGETPLRFSVRDDVLVSLSCGGPVALPPPPTATTGGEFSIAGNGRPAMTGALVRADRAEGTITPPACTRYDTTWFATRR
jgi:hypothetical protein